MLFFFTVMDQKWIKKNGPNHQEKKKNGWSYSATIRIKGCPAVGRTFDAKGEAAAWAAKTEEEIKGVMATDAEKQRAEELDNARDLDVHKWSEYPEVNKAVDQLCKEFLELPEFKGKEEYTEEAH